MIKLLKKKYNLQKQLILKHNKKQSFLNNLLKKSFFKNHFIQPILRISFLSQNNNINNLYHCYNTYQKLYCLITISGKVSNKHYGYSRFFLNKQLEKLTISGTIK
jgi:hypothetical protein